MTSDDATKAESRRIIEDLEHKLAESVTQQAATSDILRVISQSPTDVRPVFDAIVLNAVRLFRCDLAFFLRRHGNTFSQAALVGSDGSHIPLDPAALPIDPEINFPSRTIVSRKNLHLPDWSAIDLPEHERRIHETYGINSSLFLPLLLRGGECFGLLALASKRPRIFGKGEISLAESFRDQAVIAIENTRLFSEVQAKTRDLSEALQQQTATADVLKIISRSAFDLDTVLETLISTATRLCNCGPKGGQIFRREGDVYRYAASQMNVDPDYLRHEQTAEIKPGRGTLIGRVALSKRTVMIADAWSDPEYEEKDAAQTGNVRAMLGVPLLRDGEPIGAFALARSEPIAFTEREVELVTSFADQAVIAIENARLFNEVQARTRELSKSLDELRAAQDRLIQTEKLASLGQLTAGIAHEIKNPLNFVNNFSALSAELVAEMSDVLAKTSLDVARRAELDELAQMLKSNLEKVVQHGKRADSIVKNMLQHSREGSSEHRPVDINTIVDESLNLAYHGARAEKAGFSIAFQRDLDPSVGMADVYPQEITRVLLNVISNGFYAATKRKAEAGEGFKPTLAAATKNLGEKVEIRIRDNGTGISDEVMDKIFNPFFTTKPAGEGTGLGLSMTHDIIVKQHGGRIDVATKPGEFTEFIITLPRGSAVISNTE
ncbi:MAG: GAF domain-containing protein [Bradyrhizobium sp.]